MKSEFKEKVWQRCMVLEWQTNFKIQTLFQHKPEELKPTMKIVKYLLTLLELK